MSRDLKNPVLSIAHLCYCLGLHRSEASIVRKCVKHNGQYWVLNMPYDLQMQNECGGGVRGLWSENILDRWEGGGT